MSKALRCGVCGLGWRGQQIIDQLAQMDPCELVAVCDPNPKMLGPYSGLATHTEYEAFVDAGLDIVIVASPGPAHAGQSLAALERGLHILTETPCVYSIEEAKQVVAAVRRTGLHYMLAEDYLWTGSYLEMERMVGEGLLGEVCLGEGEYVHDLRGMMLADESGFVPYAERDAHPSARKTWRATNLPPIQYCSHTLGPVLRLMGRERAVSAAAMTVGEKSAPGLTPFDIESALFLTSGGTVIRQTIGFAVASDNFSVKLVGSEGALTFTTVPDARLQWLSVSRDHGKNWQEKCIDMFKRPDGRDYTRAMLEDFVQSILDDTDPPLDLYESMDMTVPGIVAHQSGLAGGGSLPVPDMRGEGLS